MLVTKALVLDAINQRQALAAVNGIRGKFNELLRVAFEIIQPGTFGQNASNRLAGQLSRVLRILEDSPQGLVFGAPALPPGPGEAGFSAGGAK